jgi:hypothetical protein
MIGRRISAGVSGGHVCTKRAGQEEIAKAETEHLDEAPRSAVQTRIIWMIPRLDRYLFSLRCERVVWNALSSASNIRTVHILSQPLEHQ